ncbi:MAG: hypothetical protein LBB60_00355 [Desulfovibrio sp.]|nr:hypothetical protein [Desulfovibrio sp.]
MKEISHGLRSAFDMMESHLANRHHVYKGTLRKNLLRMATVLETMPAFLQTYRHGTSREDVENAQRTNDALRQAINRFQIELLRRIDEERLSLRSSEMYLNFLQFARQSTNRYAIVGILQRALYGLCARESAPERAVENEAAFAGLAGRRQAKQSPMPAARQPL